MTSPATLEALAKQALDGDREAVEQLVTRLQDDVYGLALRMLWNREDAEDATQEILVRAVTRLAQFDARSKLKTWVYRIAVNYILDVKKSPVERMRLTFGGFASDLAEGLAADGDADAERSLLTEEVRVGCTLAMLQCLDRPHRLAYVLGEIMDLPGPEAAEVLEIAPALFRKRLQHARGAIEAFMRSYCGLVSDAAACACHRRVGAALRSGRVREGALDYAERPASFHDTRAYVRRVEDARQALYIHRNTRPRASSVDYARRLVSALDAGRPRP